MPRITNLPCPAAHGNNVHHLCPVVAIHHEPRHTGNHTLYIVYPAGDVVHVEVHIEFLPPKHDVQEVVVAQQVVLIGPLTLLLYHGTTVVCQNLAPLVIVSVELIIELILKL